MFSPVVQHRICSLDKHALTLSHTPTHARACNTILQTYGISSPTSPNSLRAVTTKPRSHKSQGHLALAGCFLPVFLIPTSGAQFKSTVVPLVLREILPTTIHKMAPPSVHVYFSNEHKYFSNFQESTSNVTTDDQLGLVSSFSFFFFS